MMYRRLAQILYLWSQHAVCTRASVSALGTDGDVACATAGANHILFHVQLQCSGAGRVADAGMQQAAVSHLAAHEPIGCMVLALVVGCAALGLARSHFLCVQRRVEIRLACQKFAIQAHGDGMGAHGFCRLLGQFARESGCYFPGAGLHHFLCSCG